MPTQHHWVEYPRNHSGQAVRRRFSKRIIDGEWHVHIKWIVDTTPVDDYFFPMDTDSGRAELARHCVAPDMLREE